MTKNNQNNSEMNVNQDNKILYAQLGNAKTLETITQAFKIPDNLPPVEVNGFTICWSKEALAQFNLINKDLNNIKNIPYASLRSYLEFKLSKVCTVQPDMGLSKYAINQQKQQKFACIEGGNKDKITKDLKPILNDWLQKNFVSFANKEGVSEDLIEPLRDLQEEDKLLSVNPFQSKILPWSQHENSGTAKPDDYSFPALANYLTRLIAGHEIFQGLGGIKRIISSGQTNPVELITNRISIDNKGLFSLVIKLELVTFPSLSQPLIKIDVSKRRWLNDIKEKAFDNKSISGVVFSKNHGDRVFHFKLNRRKNKDTSEYEWQPDDAFSVLQRELNLPLNISNADQILKGEASTDDCQVLLTYRNGLQQKKHGIDAGVPEKDKLEAIKAIGKIFATKGIVPFKDFSKVNITHSTEEKKNIDAASKQINKPTLLNAVLECLENNNFCHFTPKYLKENTDKQINDLLSKHFSFTLSEKGIQLFRFNKQNPDQSQELEKLIQLNKEATNRLYPNEKPLLIIFHENSNSNVVKLLQTIIQILWGDTLEIQLQRLPDNTHGGKNTLPGSNLKNKERFQKRIKAWTPIARQIAKIKRPKFSLILASEFYPNPNNSKKPVHDDLVNKPATRQALASIGRSCVQFIVPPQTWQQTGDINISDFIFPAQSSIKELLWAHSGRIDNVKEKVDKWFSEIKSEDRPKEIIDITIVRKNAGRFQGKLDGTFLPKAIRTNVETGLSEMCFCYEDPETKQFTITDWEPFTEALFDVAAISPISLGKTETERKQRFQEFVDQIISDSVNDSKNPFVMIDSSNCVKLWDWLSDRKMNLSNIDINNKQYMQDNWKGAIIVRVRQDLAPGMIEDKVKILAKTFPEDTRTKEELEANENERIKLSVPSDSKCLYKLNLENETGCMNYISVGKNTLHQNQRGVSCYRQVEQDRFSTIEKINEDGEKTYERVENQAGLKMKFIDQQKPYTGQWATPNPLEIVVTLRQEQDNPDNIAGFVESLRYGYGHFNEWTRLPAPLFFERVVRDYISAFHLEEEEDET